jgi:hypothetical protein
MNDRMRTFGYWLGVALLIAGAAAAVAERVRGPSTISFGWIWAQINANSEIGFQALIEKGPLARLWPPIRELLILPTWLILVPLGLLLVIACIRWRRSRA